MRPELAIVRAELAPHVDAGRACGAAINRDPDAVRAIAGLGFADRLTMLGRPGGAGLVERCALYEMLGYMDPNLAFGAPGPVMAGFVVDALGTSEQKTAFLARFDTGPAWAFFALTERQTGTDAAAITLSAEPIPGGGYRLNGEKYLIGQGVNGDVGVIFARTGPGPLGVVPFVIDPAEHSGFFAERLPVLGCRGTNLSRLVLHDVELPEEAALGTHLRPTERSRAAASATFDALRPCVGAVALGLARGVLDRAETADLVPSHILRGPRLRLAALLERALDLCAAAEAGKRLSREAGLCKAEAAAATMDAIDTVIAAAPPGAPVAHPWLARAWRDARAFEYAEGVSALHRLNAADLIRSTRHAA